MSNPYAILAKGVDDDDATQTNMDKKDLKEVAVATNIAEKTNEVPELFIPQFKWDKLIIVVLK